MVAAELEAARAVGRGKRVERKSGQEGAGQNRYRAERGTFVKWKPVWHESVSGDYSFDFGTRAMVK